MEKSYLDEYCNRDMATLRTSGETWAARLRETQDYVEAHGKVFLYVITPSKVAQKVAFETDHMMLVGEGALKFARAMGFAEENLLTEESRLKWLVWKRSLRDPGARAQALHPEFCEAGRIG